MLNQKTIDLIQKLRPKFAGDRLTIDPVLTAEDWGRTESEWDVPTLSMANNTLRETVNNLSSLPSSRDFFLDFFHLTSRSESVKFICKVLSDLLFNPSLVAYASPIAAKLNPLIEGERLTIAPAFTWEDWELPGEPIAELVELLNNTIAECVSGENFDRRRCTRHLHRIVLEEYGDDQFEWTFPERLFDEIALLSPPVTRWVIIDLRTADFPRSFGSTFLTEQDAIEYLLTYDELLDGHSKARYSIAPVKIQPIGNRYDALIEKAVKERG